MPQEEFLKKTSENIDFVFEQFDTQRRIGLQELKTVQEVKRNSLAKEQKRLIEKLGSDHPKVTAIGAKIQDIENRTKDMGVLINEVDTEVQPIDEKTWMVHGKVFDKDRKGIPGLTAALYDEKGKWQREIGFGCTDNNGYFAIRYVPDTTQPNFQPAASQDKKLFLYISDKNHKILYRDTEPLFVHPGQIDYRTIYISGAEDDCASPGPGGKEGVNDIKC
ncbi:MAG TPA: hypothetical protein VK186_26195 [Candidatus Deferrimicrobium sp.]|nr:hypothetical protein [Candidatus Deferrimicrobium sp.]